MAFRFRKSYGKGPFRLNFSKSGIGASIGAKGYRFTKTANGRTRSTLSVPGTGISYVSETSKRSTSRSVTSTTSTTTNTSSFSFLRLFFRIIGIFTIILSLLLCLVVPVVGIFGLALGIVEVVLTRKKKQPAPTTFEETTEENLETEIL